MSNRPETCKFAAGKSRSALLLVLALFSTACAPAANVQFSALISKAQQGDADAQYAVAVAYDYGRDVQQDQTTAARWYRKSAEQGNTVAQNSLGSLYQYGEGVKQDDGEAVRWYRKASAQGYAEAHTNLGYMYDMGRGVPRDRTKAVDLYREGAEGGSANGMLNLGVSYWQAQGVEKNLVQAYKWLEIGRFHTQGDANRETKWRIRSCLDDVKNEMTKEQIVEGDALVRDWGKARDQSSSTR